MLNVNNFDLIRNQLLELILYFFLPLKLIFS